MNIIEAESLTKTYGDFHAVNNLSFCVKEGEIYAFLGLNGAGKTTTIRMMLDMISPTHGEIKLFGKKIKSGDPLFNEIGYLVETPYAYPNLTVAENLNIYFRYRKLKDHRLVEQTIHRLDLYNYRNIKAKNLSLGNKQRLGLAKALFHSPRLLILDEPGNGLDPAGIVEVRRLLQSLSKEGTTIFVSSHLLDEVTKFATRLGIIHNGQLKREILLKDLKDEISKSLIVRVRELSRAQKILYDAGYQFRIDDDIQCLHSIEGKAITDPENVCTTLVHADLAPEEVYFEGEDLESYFLRQIT